MAIRILLVDDHQIVRDGLKSMFAGQMDIEVVGEAENGRDAVVLARRLVPDVVVMDVTMRELSGTESTRQLLAEVPATRVVALSMHSDQRSVSAMLGAGASGYVLKDTPFDELVRAIRAVADGRIFLSERVADVVVTDYVARLSPSANAPATGKHLSPREREVLQLIAEGASTKEIAARLFLSAKTVEAHRRQIMKKLDIYNVAGLIRYAVREGLVSFED